MPTFQPPPTYAEVILVDPDGRQPPRFNPIWLKWFLDLVRGLSSSGSASGTVTAVGLSLTANDGVSLSGFVTNPTTGAVISITVGLGDITPDSVATSGAIDAGTTLHAGTTVKGSSGFLAADDSPGISGTVDIDTQTLTFKNGLITGLA